MLCFDEVIYLLGAVDRKTIRGAKTQVLDSVSCVKKFSLEDSLE